MITEGPSLSTGGAWSGSRNGLAGNPGWRICLPCTDITRLRSIRLEAGLHRHYAAIRLPESHLPSSLIRLVGHTRSSMTGVSWVEQERQGLTGCLDEIMYSASGRATPGLLSQLAVNAARDIAFQREQTLGRVQQLQNFGAHVAHRREATPGRFTLTTFLGTLQNATSAHALYASCNPRYWARG